MGWGTYFWQVWSFTIVETQRNSLIHMGIYCRKVSGSSVTMFEAKVSRSSLPPTILMGLEEEVSLNILVGYLLRRDVDVVLEY